MAASDVPSTVADWLQDPVVSPGIAAFVLGRAFNECRFHLRQAFLLFANRVERASWHEFAAALEIIDKLAEHATALAKENSQVFREQLTTRLGDGKSSSSGRGEKTRLGEIEFGPVDAVMQNALPSTWEKLLPFLVSQA